MPQQASRRTHQGRHGTGHDRPDRHAQRRGAGAQECRRRDAHGRHAAREILGRPSIGWPTARLSRFWMIASAPSGFFRMPRSLKGRISKTFPPPPPMSQGHGAWIAAVWHEPRGPELLPAVSEQPKNFAEFLAHRRRRSGPASPLRKRQGGRTARRHRARPRRLAPGRRHGRRWQRRRRLDREAR